MTASVKDNLHQVRTSLLSVDIHFVHIPWHILSVIYTFSFMNLVLIDDSGQLNIAVKLINKFRVVNFRKHFSCFLFFVFGDFRLSS